MNKKCSGCGLVLQSDDKLLPGFIPEEKIDSANYCMRCFKLTHYGTIVNNEKESSNEYLINRINKYNTFKIFLIDLLNINNNTIDIFNRINGDKLLLISKIDLISNSVNISNIIENIKSVYNIKSDIRCISYKDTKSLRILSNYLERNNIRESLLVGPTNSGKSTLINALLDINLSDVDKLTISNKRNTTLEFIDIKINDSLTIIDSPGMLINDYELTTKYNKLIKPITFNMKDNEALFINNFFIKFDSKTSVTIYTYEKTNVKKYYKDIVYDYDLNIKSNIDLCINGFGFIRIINCSTISISNIDKDLISIRDSIIGM